MPKLRYRSPQVQHAEKQLRRWANWRHREVGLLSLDYGNKNILYTLGQSGSIPMMAYKSMQTKEEQAEMVDAWLNHL